jgi:ABC-type transporter Mla subunit MlaD
MRRALAVLVVLLAAAAAVVMTGARSEREQAGFKFKIAFANAFGLTEGGDLRIGGVKAGKTLKFDVSKGRECQGETPTDGPPRACAVTEAIITENGFKDIQTDAQCEIRQQSLIGEYYVDCQPGHSGNSLEEGTVIPDTRTTSTIPPDLVGDVMRRPYRDRLRLIVAELGTGLAGRPQDVSELLRKAHPGFRETQQVLEILGDQRNIIRNFISDSNVVVRELDREKRELQRWIVEAGEAAEVSASRQEAISGGFQRLPTFLQELDGTMVRLEDLTDAQTPLLRDLQAAAPSLDTFLTRLGPFSEASRPAFRSLGDTSDAGSRAIRASGEEIDMLRQLAADAPSAAKPLRQLLQTLDDRDRSVEDNPDAIATAPPAPDPTSDARGKGFTGFEALLNYAYWQTLALNQFDSVGHFLRAVLIEDPDCSHFLNDLSDRRVRERCNSWLGPDQPGITTADYGADAAAASGPTRAKRRGERRGRGEPEALPLPGQTDYSQPQPSLPSSQQELLDTLTGGGGGGSPAPSVPAPPSVPGADPVTQALDYLLSP